MESGGWSIADEIRSRAASEVLRGPRPGWMTAANPAVGEALWRAGFLAVLQSTVARYSAVERISRRNLIATALIGAAKNITEAAEHSGVDVVGALLDAGQIDIAISSLAAYQTLGRPEEASVVTIQWGGPGRGP